MKTMLILRNSSDRHAYVCVPVYACACVSARWRTRVCVNCLVPYVS